MNAKKVLLVTAALSGLSIGLVYADSSDKGKVHGPETESSPSTENMKGKVIDGECHGINSCKGKGSCRGTANECAGKNTCKAKGWLKMAKDECEKEKGEFKDHA